MKHVLTVFVLFGTACGPTVLLPSSDTGSTGAVDPSTTAQTPPTTATPDDTSPPGDDTGPTEPTGPIDSTNPTGEAMSAGFIDDPDGGGIDFECDLWAQDCPAGEKCMPWANDGGGAWNATRCSPVVDDPGQAGEPCTVEGNGVSGLDTCDFAAMCWNVDPETNEGTCRDMCTGDETSPVCDDPNTWCPLGGDGAIILCIPLCDPLVQDCPDGDVCYPLSYGFTCFPDQSGDMGQIGSSCEFTNTCDSGLFCANPAINTIVCDQGALGCCNPFCDMNGPPCPNGETCLPWFEEDDSEYVGFEHVGYCTTEG